MIRKYWDFWRYFFCSVVDFALDLSRGIFGKKLFVEIVSDFVISFGLWTNTSGLLAWKFFVFCTFGEKLWFSLKKSDGSAELNSNCPRDRNEEKISFGAAKISWLTFVSGGIFCRFFKTAFIVSEQSFWRKIYFSKKSTFFSSFLDFGWKLSSLGR